MYQVKIRAFSPCENRQQLLLYSLVPAGSQGGRAAKFASHFPIFLFYTLVWFVQLYTTGILAR
jgi:hypothetical protein